jgi:hypothetical protein
LLAIARIIYAKEENPKVRFFFVCEMCGIHYFYLMKKKRIQGKGENNKRNKSVYERLIVLVFLSSMGHKKRGKAFFRAFSSA